MHHQQLLHRGLGCAWWLRRHQRADLHAAGRCVRLLCGGEAGSLAQKGAGHRALLASSQGNLQLRAGLTLAAGRIWQNRQGLSETERVGFEPTEGFPSNDFESFAFDHSATSPRARRACITLRIDQPRTASRDPLAPLADQAPGQPAGAGPLSHSH